MIYSKSFLKNARRSKQTTFEPSAVLPDDEGRVFITSVPGAPVRVLGRLGRDGKWYIGQAGIESPHEEEQRECGELKLQTMGWMKGMAPPGDDLTEEQANAIRAWSLKTTRVNVRVDNVGSVRLQ